jgi:hypothetical protein
MDEAITPDERIEIVAANIAACERGESLFIPCPYCNALNKAGEPLCCNLLAYAAMAVCSRQEVNDTLEIAERIAEKTCQ